MSLNLAITAASSVMQSHYASQIDPPAHESSASIAHPLDAVAINPQPLPPRELALGTLLHRFDAVALNPQPLPPREALSLADRIGTVADEWCGTAPHRLPHLPPPAPPLGTASR